MEGDQRIRFRTECGWILKTQLILKFSGFAVSLVPLLACDLARTATDAFRDVDEGRLHRYGGCSFAHPLPLRRRRVSHDPLATFRCLPSKLWSLGFPLQEPRRR